MTAQGTPLTRFRRAVSARSVLLAELSAREMKGLPLAEALSLVALYAELGDKKFERAAVRWLARLAAERHLSLAEIQLAAVALVLLRENPERALLVLNQLQ